MKLDRSGAKKISDEALNALKSVAEQYGLNVKFSGGTVAPDGTNCTIKFMFSMADVDLPKKEFEKYAEAFGLSAGMYGMEIKVAGKKFSICGIKTSSYKFPILAKSDDGKTYKFSVAQVKLAMMSR